MNLTTQKISELLKDSITFASDDDKDLYHILLQRSHYLEKIIECLDLLKRKNELDYKYQSDFENREWYNKQEAYTKVLAIKEITETQFYKQLLKTMEGN